MATQSKTILAILAGAMLSRRARKYVAGNALMSKMYGIPTTDGVVAQLPTAKVNYLLPWENGEVVAALPTLDSITLRTTLLKHLDSDVGVTAALPTLDTISLKTTLIKLVQPEEFGVDAALPTLDSISLQEVLVRHDESIINKVEISLPTLNTISLTQG